MNKYGEITPSCSTINAIRFFDQEQPVFVLGALFFLLLYYIRKNEEKQIGKKVSPVHEAAFELVMKVAECVDRQERGLEIVDWVSRRSK